MRLGHPIAGAGTCLLRLRRLGSSQFRSFPNQHLDDDESNYHVHPCSGNDELWYSGEPSQQAGRFLVSPDLQISGTLTLAGRDTSLLLWAEERFDVSSMTTINGILDDLRRVSLIGCQVIGQQSRWRYDNRFICSNVVLPECIVFGDHHVAGEDEVVLRIHFDLDQSVEIFDDRDAYDTVFNQSEIIERIVATREPDRPIPVGDWNCVAYYTGKQEVFSSDTAMGRVSANHRPNFATGDSASLGLTKRTDLSLEFQHPLTVMESLHRVDRTLQFFDLVVGRSQLVPEVRIATEKDDVPEPAHVYATAYVENRPSPESRKPGVNTILINPVQEASEFSRVLEDWVAKDDKWGTARARLRRAWSGRSYGVDRLVAAANVFDLLPSDTYGSKPPLSKDLDTAKQKARRIFRGLPQSQERSSVLGCLGRIGDWTLRQKIGHRAESLVNTIGASVPDINDVIREAVALRNDYVHGPSPGYEERNRRLVFFTDSLEFIFLASDLVDAGWDIGTWCSRPKSFGHPFGDYLASYRANVAMLS